MTLARHHRLLQALAVFTTLLAHIAFAQNYPAKPVRIVVPFTTGGSSDVLGRVLAQERTTIQLLSFTLTLTFFTWVNSKSSSLDSSRPSPDCLMPPKGVPRKWDEQSLIQR